LTVTVKQIGNAHLGIAEEVWHAFFFGVLVRLSGLPPVHFGGLPKNMMFMFFSRLCVM
jgi:hypothetical protein